MWYLVSGIGYAWALHITAMLMFIFRTNSESFASSVKVGALLPTGSRRFD